MQIKSMRSSHRDKSDQRVLLRRIARQMALLPDVNFEGLPSQIHAARYSVPANAGECHQPGCEVVSFHEVGEVCAQLIAALVVEAIGGHRLDRVVHPFDLAVGR
jgi:hypothetical protein